MTAATYERLHDAITEAIDTAVAERAPPEFVAELVAVRATVAAKVNRP
jgi:hypothetical protein